MAVEARLHLPVAGAGGVLATDPDLDAAADVAEGDVRELELEVDLLAGGEGGLGRETARRRHLAGKVDDAVEGALAVRRHAAVPGPGVPHRGELGMVGREVQEHGAVDVLAVEGRATGGFRQATAALAGEDAAHRRHGQHRHQRQRHGDGEHPGPPLLRGHGRPAGDGEADDEPGARFLVVERDGALARDLLHAPLLRPFFSTRTSDVRTPCCTARRGAPSRSRRAPRQGDGALRQGLLGLPSTRRLPPRRASPLPLLEGFAKAFHLAEESSGLVPLGAGGGSPAARGRGRGAGGALGW